jgi:CHAT domain-containing protein
MIRIRILILSAIPVFVFSLPVFGFFDDIRLSSYAQKQQIHEIIAMLQPKLDKGDTLNPLQIYLLAASYTSTRDYRKALMTIDIMQKQIDRGERTYLGSDFTVYPQILRGGIYLGQGDFLKSIAEGDLAYRLLHENGREKQNFYTSQLIEIYDFLGVAHALAGHQTEAQKIAGALQKVSITVMNGPPKYSALARIYMALKEYDKALTAIRNPSARVTGFITAFYDQTFQEIPKLYILSKSLYETSNLPEARQGYDQLLRHPQIGQIGGIYWIVLCDRAKIALSEGQKSMAEDLLKKAVQVIEQQRSSINTEAGRIGFVGDKQDAYAQLIDLLLSDKRYPEAFAYVERSKARALVDLLSSQKNIPVRGENVQRLKMNLNQMAEAESELAAVSSAANRESQNKTRSVLLTLKKELGEKAPETAALVTVQAPSTTDIQKLIGSDETLLEYYSTGRNWYVFMLSPSSVAVYKLTTDDLAKDVHDFRKMITLNASESYKARAEALYRQLFAFVEPSIKTRKLIIVPHGALHYLPFCALAQGGNYLIDRYSIRTLPSASVLSFLKARTGQPRTGRSLILGNPKLDDPKYDLQFAQAEALAVGAILPNSKVLLRSEATKTNFMAESSQFSIIHLAVHGTFDPDKPLDSSLLLSGDKVSDGLLTSADLYRLSLHADLVVLSACETALGKVASGDDVIGFTRGFLYAGAGSLISSLWQVDDQATHDLMVDFYSNRKTMPKDESLRQAQIKVKQKYPHPFYWAAFLLTGNAL